MPSSFFNSRINTSLIVLTAVQTMLALLLFQFNPKSISSKPHIETYTYSADDYPRLWPIQKRPQALLFYEPHTLHYGLDDDQEWSFLTPGNGTIFLGKGNEPYSISMFHQLRCIDIIRQAIVQREELATSNLTRHCLSYLRQMILCRADTYADADALADFMICEDWQSVYSEVEKNQERILGVDCKPSPTITFFDHLLSPSFV